MSFQVMIRARKKPGDGIIGLLLWLGLLNLAAATQPPTGPPGSKGLIGTYVYDVAPENTPAASFLRARGLDMNEVVEVRHLCVCVAVCMAEVRPYKGSSPSLSELNLSAGT
jgi:hypothetical protein